jgi:hypothetical protein
MSLFPCRKCACVENTACCNYWSRKIDEKPLLCSQCDPDIDKWHGQFEKRDAAGYLVDQDGHLWRSADQLPPNGSILGYVETQNKDTQ